MIKSKSNVLETVEKFQVHGRDAVVGLDHLDGENKNFFDENDLSR